MLVSSNVTLFSLMMDTFHSQGADLPVPTQASTYTQNNCLHGRGGGGEEIPKIPPMKRKRPPT